MRFKNLNETFLMLKSYVNDDNDRLKELKERLKQYEKAYHNLSKNSKVYIKDCNYYSLKIAGLKHVIKLKLIQQTKSLLLKRNQLKTR